MKIFLVVSLMAMIGCAHPYSPQVAIPRVEKKVFFDFDSDEIKEGERAILEEEADLIKENQHLRLIVEGHTDSVGNSEYNRELGDRRARQVLVELVGQGVPPLQLIVVSCGEEKPLESNQTRQGRDKNRRVELIIRR